ncbi:MAG: tetratricopeptide repeat protein, partial [Lysobacterales bacterium]
GWVFQIIMLVLGIGFPLVLVFAWAFEMTPEGLKKEKDVDRSQSIASRTGQKLNFTIAALLMLSLAYIAYDKLTMNEMRSEPLSQESVVQMTASGDEKEAPTLNAPPQMADTQRSIVVLPFVNMSNDPDQEFFSDGLSEELLNVLAQIKDLRVISRTSAFAFKGKDVDIPTIAAQLHVTHVLEGSVRKAGDDIRITAQLIEVATDSHLWSDAYNRKMENVFEIQEEISKAIAQQLQVTLGTAGQNGKPTHNLEAYQLFLRGRHFYQNRGQEQLAQAIKLLKQAVDLDPDFAEAWANLAAANVVYGYSREDDFDNYYKDGQRAAMRAIAIDPDNGFAHAVLGLIHMGDLAWEDAMREYDLAIRLNPNETNSLLWKGIELLSLGYTEQALVIFHQAEKLDPVFTNLQYWLFMAYTVKGDVESMLSTYQKIQQLYPGYNDVNSSDYELFSGNLEVAEQIARTSEIESTGSDVLAAAVFSVLRDPKLKKQAVETLTSYKLTFGDETVNPLWRIGATEEVLVAFRNMQERGNGLRAANPLYLIWVAYDRAQLSSPLMPAFFESTGMADYWRKHGNPDYCRVEGASIECETQ